MPAVLQIGKSLAGGLIRANVGVQTKTIVEGYVIAVVGARIVGHGLAPHSGASAPKMVQGSPNVFVKGIPVCRVGDLASCGHAATNGASTVFANGA